MNVQRFKNSITTVLRSFHPKHKMKYILNMLQFRSPLLTNSEEIEVSDKLEHLVEERYVTNT